MPLKIKGLEGQYIFRPDTLSQESFDLFGTVVQNPSPSLIPSLKIEKLPPRATKANQGSALKYLDVTHMEDWYGSAPSREPSKAVMNMFVCAPRSLLKSQHAGTEGSFSIGILERHPFTTQTFIPLGVSSSNASQVRYLVIVAPSLPPSMVDENLPVPVPTNVNHHLPGRGLPDLKNIRAFIASGSQAVTYGAGTWHAPMVVVGQKPIDFVVVQFANGVALEDCQEVEFSAGNQNSMLVEIPKTELPQNKGLWKL